MPDDYQAILSDLGVDTSAQSDPASQDPAPSTPEPTQQQDATPQAEPATSGDNSQSNQPASPAQPSNNDEGTRRANEAFAAMRSENTKYKQFIQHIMKGANFQGSEQDFMKALSEASYKNQAQLQGGQVSPEILKRMDALEQQNQSMAEMANRQAFAANVKNLQEQLKLTDSDLKEFLEFAAKENLNLFDPKTDFVAVYRGIFFDKLQKQAIEDARQEWIKQSNKANNAATPDGKSGTKDPEPTNVNTMAEFDSLLQSIPKK